MKQKTLLNLWLLLFALIVGSGNAWAAENDTHDFSQSLEQLLNNNATIDPIEIAQQNYPVKEVIITYRTTQSASKFDMDVSVGSTDFGTYSSSGKKSAGTTQSFTGTATQGKVTITFTNKSGSGTGKGTLYVTNVRLVEGASGPITFTVTYDDNDATSGSVPEDDNEYEDGDEVTVLSNTGSLAKTGYAFGGWNTKADGTGTNYSAGGKFDITSDITLYAKWNPYSLSATSSNNSHGTVSVLDYVISAEPSSNYRVVAGDGGYTVTSGTATVVNNGDNTFTVTPSTDCTVQINFEEIPTHEITISTPTGGTLTVKNGDDVISSGSSVREGTTLTIVPEEDNSHIFAKWTATVGNTSTDYTDVFTYTVPASDFTLSATFDEVVKYAVNWSVNGNVTTEYYQENEDIVFPDDIADINGKTFVGWYGSTYENASTAPTYVTSATMGTSALTYYAVFADVTEEESDDVSKAEKDQTLQYDTWTYNNGTGATTDKTSYRLFGNGSYIESASFDLSKLMKVIVYGGYYGGGDYRSLSIGDGTNTWISGQVGNSNSATQSNTFTGGTALTGTGKLRITATAGNGTSTGLRISKVEIFVKGTVVTKKNFNTTVSLLPKPVITVSDVEMTWGDDDKSIDASATIADEDYDGSFIYECDDDNLTIESDGSLSCDVPGEYEVTVSIAATVEHQAASETITVTVNKKNVLLTFEDPVAVEMVSTGEYSQTLAISPAAYDGDVEYEITSSTSTGALIDDATGKLAFDKTGIIVVTATAPATDYYNGNTASYTLYVKTTPTITVSNQTLAYGATYTPTITGGTASITTVPANMATINDGVITAAVVGTSTVTITTAANDTYVAGEKSFTLTVTAPTPLAATPTPSPVVLFNETFDQFAGSGGRDDVFSGSVGSGSTSGLLDETWDTSFGNWGGEECVKLGSSGSATAITTGEINLTGSGTLTYSAAGWNDSNTNTLTITATGATLSGDTNPTLTKASWKEDYTVNITNGTGKVKLTFSMKRGFLDDVKVTRPGDPIESVAVTIPSSGLGTYCSLYPLDFSDTGTNDNNFKAYVVTGIDGNNITLQKLTTEVKGGVPFVIVGEGSSQVEIPTADNCSYVPSNELVGTLAPTYVTGTTAGYTNYGMSGGKFKKINTGIVPANRAYLPIADAEAREFNLVFLDDEVTGIRTVDNGRLTMDKNAVYDLSGRRVQNPKHGLYIVNGKKVIIK